MKTELDKAIKLVKAAGYRVTKPKPKKLPTRGPTFICVFTDGVKTKMTVHCADNKLDWARGEKLARMAYESRTGAFPPPIVKRIFQRDGYVLDSRG